MMTLRTQLCTVALLLVGCAPSVNAVARQASKAAVDEGAEELTRQDTQEALADAAKDPDIRQATSAMTDQIAEGILKSLESERAHQQIAGLTRTITQTAVQQLVASLGSQQTRAQLVGLTSAVTDAALKQAAASLQTEFRPVVRAMIQEDIAKGMASALKNDLQPELGATAQNVAYHAVVGANNGLGAAWAGSDGMVGEARMAGPATLSSVRPWLWGALTMVGLVTLIFLSAAAMMIARARRTRAEVARLESATLLLATAMRERQQTQNSDEIVTIVQQALEGRAERTGKHRILGALRMRKAS